MNKKTLHYLIVVFFAFFFKFIPAPEPITASGMHILGIFFAIIYGWSFVERFAPAMLAMVSLATLSVDGGETYLGMGSILQRGLGSDIVWFLTTMWLLMNVMDDIGLTEKMAKYIMSRELLNKNPWIMTAFFLIAAYIIGTINLMSSMFFVWAILYKVVDSAGYEKKSPYPTLMIIGISIFAVWGFCSMPFQSQASIVFATIGSALGGFTPATEFNFGSYFVFSFALSAVGIITFLLLMRFIFNVNVSKLNEVDLAKAVNYQKGFTKAQKHVTFALVFIIVTIFVVPILKLIGVNNTFVRTLASLKTYGIMAIALSYLIIVKCDGKSIFDWQRSMKMGIPWQIIISFAIVLPLGGQLKNPAHGIIQLFTSLATSLSSLPMYMFVVIFIFIGFILTNFASNNAIVQAIAPVIVTICPLYGIPVQIIPVMLVFAVNLAFFTPAASGFAAVLHSNDRYYSGYGAKYLITSLVSMVLIIVTFGFVMANVLF